MNGRKHAVDLDVFRVDPRELDSGDWVAVSTGRGSTDFAIRYVVGTHPPPADGGEFTVDYCGGESATWETEATDDDGNWEVDGTAVRIPRELLRSLLERARSDMASFPGSYHDVELGAHALDLPGLRADPAELEPGDFLAIGTESGYRLRMVAEVDVATDGPDGFGIRFCSGDVETWRPTVPDSADIQEDDGVVRLSADAVTFQFIRAESDWLCDATEGTDDPITCPFCGLLHIPREPCDG